MGGKKFFFGKPEGGSIMLSGHFFYLEVLWRGVRRDQDFRVNDPFAPLNEALGTILSLVLLKVVGVIAT